MMHHCCSGNYSQGGHTCTCGMYHSQTDSYSMFFSMPNNQHYQEEEEEDEYDLQHHDTYNSPPVVDCTLSLGTPSTRLTDINQENEKRNHRRGSSITKFFSTKNKSSSRSSSGLISTNCSSSNNDSLLARRCANCDTTSTPLWRNGPRGPKSLCNACGIRYKKEERRAAAAAATTTVGTGGVLESGNYDGYSHPWYIHQQSHQMYGGESQDNYNPFMSWRLNVADRTSQLVHDFTG